MTTNYCDVEDVSEFLQKKSFSVDTTPSYLEVENLINRYEDYIDNRTNHAWRTKTITDEFIDSPTPVIGIGYAFFLKHRDIKTLTSGTDFVYIFDGSTEIEYIANKTEGRANDFFLDKTNGVVYIRDRNLFYPKGARFTYRYGKTTVDGDIKHACILLVASAILSMNDKSARFVDDGPSNRFSHRDRTDMWREQAEDILDRKKEMVIC